MNIQEYRIGTLKRCEVEILDIIETGDVKPGTLFVLKDLLRQIRVSLGEEIAVPRKI